MKSFLFLFITVFLMGSASRQAAAQGNLPPKPEGRIVDYADIMQADDRARLSKQLAAQFEKNHVSVYVATFQNLSSNDAAVVDTLREAWVTDPLGFVLLYNRSRDKLSLSLTKGVFDKFSAPGELQQLANQMDIINKEGPATSVPRAVDAVLNKLNPVDDGRQKLLDDQERAAKWSFVLPAGIVLAVVLYGLYLAWQRLKSQNVFERSEALPVGSAKAKFGSNLGGTSFGSVKIR